MGSADLMPRNLNRRVEIIFPVKDQVYVRYLRDEVLDIYLKDNVKARYMGPDGNYGRVRPTVGQGEICVQEWLLAQRARWTEAAIGSPFPIAESA